MDGGGAELLARGSPGLASQPARWTPLAMARGITFVRGETLHPSGPRAAATEQDTSEEPELHAPDDEDIAREWFD